MRPSSIVAFERVALVSIAVGILKLALSWNAAVAAVARHGYGSGLVAATNAFLFAVMLLLLYLISRRRSNVARWIWIALFAIGFGYSVATGTLYIPGPTLWLILDAIGWLLGALGVWLLLRRDSSLWFSGRGEAA